MYSGVGGDYDCESDGSKAREQLEPGAIGDGKRLKVSRIQTPRMTWSIEYHYDLPCLVSQ